MSEKNMRGGLVQAAGPLISIWKTIKLGTGLKSAEDFRRALYDGGFKLSAWTLDILRSPAFKTTNEETEVDLVVVTVGKLGFWNGARQDQICDRAKKLGLELCPPEVGPQLRLQYQDQPKGERILVAMQPIIRSHGGSPKLFSVECDDSSLWLSSHWGHPGSLWNAGNQWVFTVPASNLRP